MGKKIELTDEQLEALLSVEEEEVVAEDQAADNQATLDMTPLQKKKIKAEFDEGEDEAEVEVYEEDESEESDDEEEVSEESEEDKEEMEESEEESDDEEEVSEESEEEDEEDKEEVEEACASDDEEEKKEEKEVDIEEDMNALFNGEDLSEEFMEKASTIFGAALKSHLSEEVSKLEEEYASKLKESVQEVSDTLTDKIDAYLDYVVEEWVKENEVAIEHGLRLEIMEGFMSDLKTLFENNNIEVPAEKVDLVAEAQSALKDKEAELNEEINRNVELNRQLSDLRKQAIIDTVSEGLTATQSEKLVGLAEGVEFVDVESYESKIKMIRENYFPSETEIDSEVDETSGDVLVEETDKETKVTTDPLMESYVSAISRTVKK